MEQNTQGGWKWYKVHERDAGSSWAWLDPSHLCPQGPSRFLLGTWEQGQGSHPGGEAQKPPCDNTNGQGEPPSPQNCSVPALTLQ